MWFQIKDIPLHSKSNKMQTKEQVIESLKNIPYDVIFTRDSVIEIIESIKSAEPQSNVDYDKIKKEVTERVIDALESINSEDLVMNPTFTLRGNEIELDSIDIDEREVRNAVKYTLDEYFAELEEEQVQEEIN